MAARVRHDREGFGARRGRTAGGASVLLAAALVAAAASPALGQEAGADRPYRGLFEAVAVASPASARSAGPAFAYSVRTFEQAGFPDGGAAPGGSPWFSDYLALEAAASARRAWRRTSARIQAGAQLRAYHDSRGGQLDQQWLAADVETRLTRRVDLAVSARADYASSYAPGSPLGRALEPGEAAPSRGGLELTALRNAGVAGSLRVTRRMGRQTDARAAYSRGFVRYLDSDGVVSNTRLSAGLKRLVGDSLSLDLAYDFSRVASSRGDGGLRTDAHEVNVTARYTPASSPSTSIVVSALPTFASRRTTPAQPLAAGAEGAFTARLGAVAAVEHRLTARFRAGAAYQRALYSDDGYVQPSFVQTGGGRIDVTLSRRVTVDLSASYSTGLASAASPGAVLNRLESAARISLRASRLAHVSAEFQHASYRQHAGGGVSRSSSMPGGRSLRVGVTIAPPAM